MYVLITICGTSMRPCERQVCLENTGEKPNFKPVTLPIRKIRRNKRWVELVDPQQTLSSYWSCNKASVSELNCDAYFIKYFIVHNKSSDSNYIHFCFIWSIFRLISRKPCTKIMLPVNIKFRFSNIFPLSWAWFYFVEKQSLWCLMKMT